MSYELSALSLPGSSADIIAGPVLSSGGHTLGASVIEDPSTGKGRANIAISPPIAIPIPVLSDGIVCEICFTVATNPVEGCTRLMFESQSVDFGSTEGRDIGAFAQAGGGICLASGIDPDGDQQIGVCDICPFIANPAQTDSGGIGTDLPDGVGDSCQCGDVNGDGTVLIDDVVRIRRGLAGLLLVGPVGDQSPVISDPSSCNVVGTISPDDLDDNGVRDDCTPEDAIRIRNALAQVDPGIDQVCQPDQPN